MTILGVTASSYPSKGYWVGFLADSNALASQNDNAYSTVFDSTGNQYVAGTYTPTVGGSHGFILKYDAGGAVQWARSLADARPAGTQQTYIYDVALDSSGNPVVCGQLQNTSNGREGFLVKYNSSGTLQFKTSYYDQMPIGSRNTIFTKLLIDSAGNIVVSGKGNKSSTAFEALILKTNSAGVFTSSTGVFSQFFNNYNDYFSSIARDSSNNYFVAGYGRPNPDNIFNANLTKYNSSLTRQWTKSYYVSGSGSTFGDCVAVDNNGDVYMGGYGRNTSSGFPAFIAKFDTSGTLLWDKVINGPLALSAQSNRTLNITTDSSNAVYAVGNYNTVAGNAVGMLIKYNSTGTLQFQRSLTDSGSPISTTFRDARANSPANLYGSGSFRNSGGGVNAFAQRIPLDGSKTGTWTLDANRQLTYAVGNTSDGGTGVSTGWGINNGGQTISTETATLTDTALTLTNGKILI